MVASGISTAIASMWSSMASWSTPGLLFCLLNLVIATIFIASNFKSPNNNHNHYPPSQLARSPSLLERVKSVDLSSFYTTTPESQDHYETTGYNSVSQLGRPPSLLQRVKSIDFSFSSFHNNSLPIESEQLGDSTSHQLGRSPSLLDRVKSFKLSSPFGSDHHSDEIISTKDDVIPAKSSPRKLRKSGSEKRIVASDEGEEDVDRRRPATMKESVGVYDESVDAKADDFINRFKQQLKLQRLDSLKRFREMLNRGTSSG